MSLKHGNKIKKWAARVTVDGKAINIGIYETIAEASKARDDFLREIFPNVFTERHGR